MEMFISLLVQIISGAVGGNLAGMTKQSLGTGLNTLIGAVGGLVLGQLVSALTGTPGGEALDVAAVGSNIVGSGVGGLVLTWVIGFIKSKLAAKSARTNRSPPLCGGGLHCVRSLCPRSRCGSIWSRTRCLSTLASGKPPSALRSQICTPSQVMRNAPPVAGSSATLPRSSAKVLNSSWASHAARSNHWHCVQ